MKVLLIEDNENKRQKIRSFLTTSLKAVIIDEAKSYRSGLEQILNQKYDVILLDMSMPLFDITKDDPHPEHDTFAGKEILMQMDLRDIVCPVVVLTQFNVFDVGKHKIDLKSLNQDLMNSYPEIYKGSVFYSTTQNIWGRELIHLLQSIGAV